MSEKRDRPLKILFVCLANLCRSPLAEVIARSLHRGEVEPASAGVSPAAGPPFEEALQVVKKFYGADLRRHRPRHVLDYDLSAFDYLIALDSAVFMKLASMDEIPQDKLYGWEVADPCGLGLSAYESTARLIEREIETFLVQRDREKRAARRRRAE
ncbi:MAG: low molecular weight phosphatase family protein [Candidatus Aminicenantes bacterium]|nr:low molecular weight phosphatase family protein [Candidatus Aminicenantes bacterium]